MTELPKTPAGLGEIAAQYDALLCDVWGVVHNGKAAFAAATNALTQFRRSGGIVVMLTNAPRPSTEIPAQFAALGVPDECWDGIVTSGDATKAMLSQSAPGPAFKLGPSKDDRLYDGTGMAFAELEEAKLISCTGFYDDNRETPGDYDDLLKRAAALNLPMICANPDKVVHFGDRLIYCAGALAENYAALGGKVVYTGKPHDAIYQLCYERLAALRGQPIDKSRILAIGDGLPTDILGAASQSLDCLFVTGGIHGAYFSGGVYAEEVGQLLQDHQTRARYAISSLCW
ncbi:MAG: TIGR01459 family HAD-type hydrolase [Robiginitomaculum sp.]|nr:MAG: TIGR01459 family HAD-type hydrolase [Robiginitomaculum sp.]